VYLQQLKIGDRLQIAQQNTNSFSRFRRGNLVPVTDFHRALLFRDNSRSSCRRNTERILPSLGLEAGMTSNPEWKYGGTKRSGQTELLRESGHIEILAHGLRFTLSDLHDLATSSYTTAAAKAALTAFQSLLLYAMEGAFKSRPPEFIASPRKQSMALPCLWLPKARGISWTNNSIAHCRADARRRHDHPASLTHTIVHEAAGQDQWSGSSEQLI
jgi:hypothetical protein